MDQKETGQITEYRVEPEGKGCAHCGLGEAWSVVNSMNVAMPTSYGDKESAQDMADDLNTAFSRGWQAASDERAQRAAVSERISDERLEQFTNLAETGSFCLDPGEDAECFAALKELKELRSTIRLLTEELERRVNWNEQDCSQCLTGTQCAAHAALEAGRKWSEE